MVATTTIRHRQPDRKNHLETRRPSAAAIAHAVRIIHAVCGLAGSATLIDDVRADLRADKVQAAIRHRDTAVVFDWLMAALSYQGIADAVAYDYMERHGRAVWRDIDQKLGRGHATWARRTTAPRDKKELLRTLLEEIAATTMK
jgi:hypothetical protein